MFYVTLFYVIDFFCPTLDALRQITLRFTDVFIFIINAVSSQMQSL